MADAKNSELSSRAGFGNSNPTEPPAVDVERQLMPDRAPETASNINTKPPARTGPAAQAPEEPAAAGDDSNPTHHSGRIPPNVTLDRD
ncbi:hypothetical protein [Pseudorhizobium tarimense]|uniref:hypothetical protein n=1 Tax=Pseudorhizobium tarimense TaxID=1079109 RepID=UPI001FF2BCDD|nr:hypothetical protein [Pseudorhizobium tarimense]MCJ8518709.1 hypothetical protein [Pseudorhizobium tarimense]